VAFVWTQLAPPSQPSLFGYAGMAPDHVNGTLVVAGGGSSVNQQHAWALNVAAPSWTDLGLVYTTGNLGRRTLAWDDANSQIVAFGGSGGAGIAIAETWVWNGATWTLLTPATSPPKRYSCAMAYSPALGAVVMSGGYDNNGATSRTDTWKWDGTTWTQLFPATTPSNLGGGSLCVLGSNLYELDPSGLNFTWQWDGTDWTALTPALSPSTRDNYYAAPYPNTSQIILWGGRFGGSTVADTNVWGFDGTTWSHQTVTGVAPPVGAQGACGLDPASGSKIIIKDGVTSSSFFVQTWQLAGPAAPAGTPRARVTLI
jgi:hypothetical protein